MSLRSSLAQVRHLGSAKDGTAQWWALRMTSLALVPLVLWFVISVLSLVGADHATFVAWASQPVTAGLLILLIFATFHHAAAGLKEVIEDYVHSHAPKIALILLAQGASIVLGLAGILSVLSLLF
jgi:succinate dehydrogenase / fumarate reductase membrane anchor subunit|tara:strand:- start:2887 stop:3261 length:375 start_codon:yes stop_codon:yes gene_type:complete